MQQFLVTVQYRVTGDRARFLEDVSKAAPVIAEAPGLAWKIWGFDQDRGVGVSAYLFAHESAARAYVAGPVLERLRSRADVADVSFEIAPVDQQLSAVTGATRALAVRQTAPAS